MGKAMKINIGGGLKRYEGFVNLDHDSMTNPDYVVDLEKDRLPFDDSMVEEVKAYHILEHIGEGFLHLMKELYRICKPGAVIDIAVPHHRHENYFGDPTHRRPITVEMFKQFSKKYCEWHQECHGSSTGFAPRLGVDFEVAHYEYSIEKDYLELSKEGKNEELMELAKRFNNVFIDVFIKLLVIKD